ncbi:MAG: hypothetical protein PHQ11_04700 [Paludibacter sp.]|nr:hypothetical protein [Paludibacter sp.]MDD4199033.1 hypothetical protein [Paludibacter sp.]MDD4426802.1 hypothetical protein [Paludibacter sp.]
MRKRITIFILLITLLCKTDILAQQVTVNASIDSVQIWIGQQTQLHFVYSQQPGQFVQAPIFSDAIVKGLEIVDRLKGDTVKAADGHLDIRQSYVVTSFEDTLLLIPPFPFVSGEDTIWSKDLSLKVVQPFVIDTTDIQVADIKDVFKPEFSLKYFLKKLLPWLIGAVLLVALVYLIVILLKRRKVVTPEEVKPNIPPYELAISRLEKIRQEKLWQQNRHKEYHSELTDVLREYIEEVFEIPAMEMTSDEILTQLNFLRIEKKAVYQKLQQILHLADLIKFAKWNVGPDEHELSLNNAFVFVNETKIEEEQEPKTEEEIKEDDIS